MTALTIKRIAVLVVLFAVGILYYNIDPIEVAMAPKCVFKMLTGLQCPSCGIQRALHCLLHGDVVAAVRYNPFLAVAVPYAFAAVLSTWYNFGHRLDFLRRIVYSRAALLSFACIFIGWWILRNILHI